jgi:hypothetical protein
MNSFKMISAAALLALAGCVDAELEVTILGDNSAHVSGYFQMDGQMYQMSGADSSFCDPAEGGTLTVTEAFARCDIDITGPFDELFAIEEGEDPNGQPTFEALGNGVVRIIFPYDALGADSAEMAQDPEMMAMFRPMLEGHSIVTRVTGANIVSSNGEVSADGRTASYTLDLLTLIGAQGAPAQSFSSDVAY